MNQKLFTRNFTFLVLGQCFSLFANFTLKFALSMYVLEQTGSATIFAGMLAAAMLPTILLSPLGGILADRANRRNIMVILDALSGICILLAALFLNTGNDILVIGVLLVVLSVLGAFESPTVQACVPQMQTGENILKGNAVVNQIAAVASLITPFLGSVFYTAFGIKPVLYTTMVFFFITAIFECFIQLHYQKSEEEKNILQIVKEDLSVSMRFLCKEQPNVLKLLLLASLVSFFVAGTAIVGFPYLVRTVLGLSASHYGAAESALGIATLLGGISTGLLSKKLSLKKLYLFLVAFGICMLPVGCVFLLPIHVFSQYLIIVAAFCGGQIACSIFSIFALSAIQERTPQNLTGKVMAYIATISMCAQPFGQILYGRLFDTFKNSIYIVLIPTGIIICIIGFLSIRFFSKIEDS